MTPHVPDDLLERFASLFQGYSRAFGQFVTTKATDTGKVTGRAQTVRGEVGPEQFRQHLDGEGAGLGIIMLRDDDTVVFGAIDYDNKLMDHLEASKLITQLGLPLILCRSKSGGGHFYCFLSEPAPAELMRRRLSQWAALLRMAATTEIFPKQSARFNKDDIGSWINLPYYHAARTMRYALFDGKPAKLTEFLDRAEHGRITSDQLADWQIASTSSDLFEDGPPCLQLLHEQGGFVEGTKKDGMFSVAVYLRKRFPDDWETRLEEYNRVMANLRADEVVGLIKSHKKKEYAYKCKLPPLNAVCQKKECLSRKYGVGNGAEDIDLLEVSSLTRYEPTNAQDDPVWGLEVKGRRIRLTNEQFFSQAPFRQACLAKAGFLPPQMSAQRWDKFQRDLLASVTVVAMPDDAGPLGQLWQRVEAFASQRVMAEEPEGVLRGAPFRRDGRVYFRSSDLFQYLSNHRFRYREQDVWSLLNDRSGGHEEWSLGGGSVQVWWIPAPRTSNMGATALEDADFETEPF